MSIILNIIVYAGIVQGFYLAFLLVKNKNRNYANNFLSVFLIVMSLSIMHSEFVLPEIHKSFLDPYRIKEPFLMLVIPFIWLYLKAIVHPAFRVSAKDMIHFLPFTFFMAVSIPVFLHGPESTMGQLLSVYSIPFDICIWLVLLVQYSCYLVHIIKLSHKHRLDAEQELSNIEKVDIEWLNTFVYCFIAVLLLLAFLFVVSMHHLQFKWLNQSTSILLSVAIFVLGYKGLFQESIFSNIELSGKEEVAEVSFNQKMTTIDETLVSRLQTYMENEKPFLEPELTLTSLAGQVKISRNQLSEIINTRFECNFYDFVNKYRIEEVKQRMKTNKDFTILAIAFDAGFPSKSTFNSVFKKFTGLTPSEYRTGLL
jgi:AraC-like DNA-binding protein